MTFVPFGAIMSYLLQRDFLFQPKKIFSNDKPVFLCQHVIQNGEPLLELHACYQLSSVKYFTRSELGLRCINNLAFATNAWRTYNMVSNITL